MFFTCYWITCWIPWEKEEGLNFKKQMKKGDRELAIIGKTRGCWSVKYFSVQKSFRIKMVDWSLNSEIRSSIMVFENNIRGMKWMEIRLQRTFQGVTRSVGSLSINLIKAWICFAKQREKMLCSWHRAYQWNIFNFMLRNLYLIHCGIGLFK